MKEGVEAGAGEPATGPGSQRPLEEGAGDAAACGGSSQRGSRWVREAAAMKAGLERQ